MLQGALQSAVSTAVLVDEYQHDWVLGKAHGHHHALFPAVASLCRCALRLDGLVT